MADTIFIFRCYTFFFVAKYMFDFEHTKCRFFYLKEMYIKLIY